jgi:hypothetical protein
MLPNPFMASTGRIPPLPELKIDQPNASANKHEAGRKTKGQNNYNQRHHCVKSRNWSKNLVEVH